VVDQQFRAAAITLAAQQHESGKPSGAVIHFPRSLRSLTQVEHYSPAEISQWKSVNFFPTLPASRNKRSNGIPLAGLANTRLGLADTPVRLAKS
jgi:hypothetical protein